MNTKNYFTEKDLGIQKPTSMNRRSFLKSSLCATAGLLLPTAAFASIVKPKPRHLCFYHTHTGEKIEIEYTPGKYRAPVRNALEDFLRDFRTGERHSLDPHLFDSLCAIQDCCGRQASFEVISGYRSPKTNAYLRQNSSGVAKKSLHMQGRAIDIRVSELPTSMLRDLALQLHNGGVGYYPKSDFVHIDTGRKRSW
jgi:uncharacterized protein YcbK (DUF882 family)